MNNFEKAKAHRIYQKNYLERQKALNPYNLDNKKAKELYEEAKNNLIDRLGGSVWVTIPDFRQTGLIAEEMRKIKKEGRYKETQKDAFSNWFRRPYTDKGLQYRP